MAAIDEYLYGDGTAFPIQQNFIHTIRTTTEVCVRLFEAELAVREHRRALRTQQAGAVHELEQLDAIEDAVADSLDSVVAATPEHSATLSQTTAAELLSTVKILVERARQSMAEPRPHTLEDLLGPQQSQSVLDSLRLLLRTRTLPATTWTTEWRYDFVAQRAKARTTAHIAASLTAEFSCSVEQRQHWTTPPRANDIEPKLLLRVQGGSNRVHRRLVNTQLLEQLYITKVCQSPEVRSIRLSESGHEQSPGYVVVFDDNGPSLSQVDADGHVQRTTCPLQAHQIEGLNALWEKVETMLAEARSQRETLTYIGFEGERIQHCLRPADVAHALLNTLAPVVREMRKRSQVHGELVQKQHALDGERREHFVPRAELRVIFAHLPSLFKLHFEAIGLGDDPTDEWKYPSALHTVDDEAIVHTRDVEMDDDLAIPMEGSAASGDINAAKPASDLDENLADLAANAQPDATATSEPGMRLEDITLTDPKAMSAQLLDAALATEVGPIPEHDELLNPALTNPHAYQRASSSAA